VRVEASYNIIDYLPFPLSSTTSLSSQQLLYNTHNARPEEKDRANDWLQRHVGQEVRQGH
jgi:hypothetical protein